MKTLIVILIIASFLQTTIIPINLVLLILICRASIKSESANLYLAFAFGLLTAHLNLTSLGLTSLVYLVAIQLTQVLSKLQLAGNPLLIIPTSLALLLFYQATNVVINHQALQVLQTIIASFLSLPIFYLVKLWEERFIVQKEIKLKL